MAPSLCLWEMGLPWLCPHLAPAPVTFVTLSPTARRRCGCMPGAAHEENSQIYKVRVGRRSESEGHCESLGGERGGKGDWDGVRRCRGE